MASERLERRLTAIMAADVAGYSRLTSQDEEGTHVQLQNYLRTLVDPKIAEHRGHVVKNTGDGMLAEFSSVVDAVRCALDVQRGMEERNTTVPQEKRIEFRIGINVGDIISDRGDIFGDSVNIAARLEGVAEGGGICVSEDVYRQVADKLKVAFDDMGAQQLKNIARPVRIYRARLDRIAPDKPSAPSLPLPDKPSIAVLPFANMSGDPSQEYFADGMVEEIITALSRIKWLFVIARTSSFAYKHEATDIKQIGRELGVRYVLEGSVRRVAQTVRITAQLIDALNGAHLWAERFDGSLENIFELQDQVALSVAGVIEPTLLAAEIRRSAERPTTDLTAYDLYLRALSLGSSWQKDGTIAGLALLERAIERDPHYGPALALASQRRVDLHSTGWGADPAANRRSGIDLAQRALGAANEDPYVLATAAYVLAYFGESIDAAIKLVDRALAINPSFARGWVISGWLRLWAGEPELALRNLNNSLRLSPRARTAGTLMAIGVAHFFARRFDDATAMLLASLQEHPGWAPTYRFLASCYAHMGRLQDAREAIRKLQAVTEVVVPTAAHWRRPEFREFFLAGLRMAIARQE